MLETNSEHNELHNEHNEHNELNNKHNELNNEHNEHNELHNELNIQLIPYKNINKLIVKKYHIVDLNNKIIKHKICNIFAPFGREADFNKFKSSQQRFNICFTLKDIELKNKSYCDFTNLILQYEKYFKQFSEFKDYELISNIINRDKYGIIIRCHLKTNKDKTISPLFQINKINLNPEQVEWIQFNKNNQFNMKYNFDCLWIDDKNRKFGISIQVLSILQVITDL
jgi:hypothetical protein